MEYTGTKQLEDEETESGALEVRRLTFTEAVMLVVGATIGSGVLGLAYASRKAGWPVLLTWLLAAGFLSVASMLYVAETALRTRRPLQLSGLAEKYVGKAGSWLIFWISRTRSALMPISSPISSGVGSRPRSWSS